MTLVLVHGGSFAATMARQAGTNEASDSAMLDAATASAWFGSDLDDVGIASMLERMVPESPVITQEPVDLTGLDRPLPRTWIRLLQDQVVTPDNQDRFTATVRAESVVDMDAGHMAMIGHPDQLAQILNDLP